MNSIRIKLLLICVAIMLIVMSVCGTIMLQTVKANEILKSRGQLETYAARIDEQIVQVAEEPSQFRDGFERLEMGAADSDIEGGVMDALGAVVAPFEMLGQRVTNSAVVAALAGQPGFESGRHAPDKNGLQREWLNYAHPVEKDGARYVIFARMDAAPMNANLSQLTVTIVLMVVIALVLTAAIWYVFASETLTRPIIALTKHSKDMAEGRLDREMPVHSNDEIGQLTESFNHMARELNQTLESISVETNKRGAILQNMTDGVLAYDAAGSLIHANTASGELLQFEDIQTTPMAEVLKRLGLDPDEVYRLPEDKVKESTIAVSDRFVTASVTPYMNNHGEVDGFIIVLQDVTKTTKLDRMRKDFVANVSHELRTPLTSVQTYAETLLDGALDDRDMAVDFLKVIHSETERMVLLVSDLLELSRLDSKSVPMEREVVDLVSLLRLTIRQTAVLTGGKRQHVAFDPPAKPYFIEASASRINQVITNIITNSVKYSPENTEIRIRLEETDRYYRVFITDQGMGIPQDDLPHIFERFYRVDKARSRAMGGTGLGLAIADEIMREHGGRITAISELEHGTTIVLRFPRYRNR